MPIPYRTMTLLSFTLGVDGCGNVTRFYHEDRQLQALPVPEGQRLMPGRDVEAVRITGTLLHQPDVTVTEGALIRDTDGTIYRAVGCDMPSPGYPWPGTAAAVIPIQRVVKLP